jgi:hypothetical protein
MSCLVWLTAIHTALSLVAIGAGFLAVSYMVGKRLAYEWLPVFIFLAWTTSLTGFLFPFNGITPAFGTGIVAVAVLAVMYVAKVFFRLKGMWRRVYVGGVVANLYFLLLAGVAQTFLKVKAVHALAPTQGEPPFLIAQVMVLVLLVVLGVYTVKNHPVATRL